MAAAGEAAPRWSTTVIVSSSLQKHAAYRLLSSQQHRVRCSDSVESGCFIFPTAGIAFLLIDPHDLPEPLDEPRLLQQIESFVKVHRNCFVLLQAPPGGTRAPHILTLIQNRFLGSNLRILPVRNDAELVKGMLTIAKATSKPHADSIRDRMSLAKAHIIDTSPMWEMLRDML
ncbi:protein SPO16 homolog [Cololabis saira]|uniref:protein SPO16 homolog n=1 Tax=Cololabis saira TaxID=129043 RepID=UPI002AD44E3E|nr:protein SPO16 homolog [Cololabis saira]